MITVSLLEYVLKLGVSGKFIIFINENNSLRKPVNVLAKKCLTKQDAARTSGRVEILPSFQSKTNKLKVID